ncbi:MAG: MFS transporter [Thermoanaerobaculia bacterium]|nr:MFS transporter [Thermoanaerobaculia bacterium]
MTPTHHGTIDAEPAAAVAATPSRDYPTLSAANYGVILLFLAYVLSFLDRQILSLLVGPIRDQFGITDFQYSLLAGAAFSLTYAFAGLPLGRLADVYSRKLLVAASVAFWSLATGACGLAASFGGLFAARMAVGAGEAGLAPPAYSIITDSYRPRHFGYAMSFYQTAVQVGSGLAFVIGGFLIDRYTAVGPVDLPLLGTVQPWQATLFTVGLPGVVLALLILSMVEPRRKELAVSRSGRDRLPVRTLVDFLWRRRRAYLSLFLGSSLLSMAGYGSSAWYPEFLVRNYGMSKAAAGSSYGTITITAGVVGIMMGPWIANRLADRGYRDAYVRTFLITTIITIVPSVAAPLAGSSGLTLLILWPAMVFSSAYLGVMAASFQPITPNQMRGQTTALYIMGTSLIGMTVGTSALAAFTDFLFQDDGKLHYSIAMANGVFKPAAAVLFWYGLPAYRRCMQEAGRWEVD